MNDIHHKKLERGLYKPEPVRCDHCGNLTFKTWHKLSAPHLKGLVKLGQAVHQLGRPATRYEAGIIGDGSQYGNLAAMRWWGLIEPTEGKAWTLTKLGWDFLRNKRGVAERVLTLRGELIGVSVGLKHFKELADSNTWEKADYLAHRIAVTEKDYSPNSLFARFLIN